MTKLLRVTEVAELTGIPEATLRFWRHQSSNGHEVGPRSAKLGPRRVVYREAEVLAWIDQQFENDNPQPAVAK
jgi:predicted DNA-binding transcriptional regulator AlpA